jgi:hypothetical protein
MELTQLRYTKKQKELYSQDIANRMYVLKQLAEWEKDAEKNEERKKMQEEYSAKKAKLNDENLSDSEIVTI